MSEPTEQSVNDSIEETGGIPEITFGVQVFGMTQTAVDKTLSIEDMAADAKATGDAIADLAADVAACVLPSELYPVGSVYVTTADALPLKIANVGTWEEILVPLTWNDVKTGTRSYGSMGQGQTGGTMHFWLRTA